MLLFGRWLWLKVVFLWKSQGRENLLALSMLSTTDFCGIWHVSIDPHIPNIVWLMLGEFQDCTGWKIQNMFCHLEFVCHLGCHVFVIWVVDFLLFVCHCLSCLCCFEGFCHVFVMFEAFVVFLLFCWSFFGCHVFVKWQTIHDKTCHQGKTPKTWKMTKTRMTKTTDSPKWEWQKNDNHKYRTSPSLSRQESHKITYCESPTTTPILLLGYILYILLFFLNQWQTYGGVPYPHICWLVDTRLLDGFQKDCNYYSTMVSLHWTCWST